jgi:hypothetical protein
MKSQSEPIRFFVRSQKAKAAFDSPRLFQRMLFHGWFKPVVQGGPGKSSLFNAEDLQAAAERIKTGEQPPLLPCESRRQRN